MFLSIVTNQIATFQAVRHGELNIDANFATSVLVFVHSTHVFILRHPNRKHSSTLISCFTICYVTLKGDITQDYFQRNSQNSGNNMLNGFQKPATCHLNEILR